MTIIIQQIFWAILLSLGLTIILGIALVFYYQQGGRAHADLSREASVDQKIKEFIAKANPGLEWVQASTVQEITYPIWHCEALNSDPDLVESLIHHLLVRYGRKLANSYVYGVTETATNFLITFRTRLQDSGVTILDERRIQNGITDELRNIKLVLFDFNLNTGQTMKNAEKRFLDLGWVPEMCMVLLNNDFVPDAEKVLSSNDWEHIGYLFRASDLASDLLVELVHSAVSDLRLEEVMEAYNILNSAVEEEGDIGAVPAARIVIENLYALRSYTPHLKPRNKDDLSDFVRSREFLVALHNN